MRYLILVVYTSRRWLPVLGSGWWCVCVRVCLFFCGFPAGKRLWVVDRLCCSLFCKAVLCLCWRVMFCLLRLWVILIGELYSPHNFHVFFALFFTASRFSCFFFLNMRNSTNLIFLLLESFTKSDRTPPFFDYTPNYFYCKLWKHWKKSSPMRKNEPHLDTYHSAPMS